MDDKIAVTLEPLEKIFRQVEEESERRAQEEAHDSFHGVNSPSQFYSHATPPANGIRNSVLANAGDMKKARDRRRRGSISISRIGQLASEDFYKSPGSSGPPTPNLVSSIASHSPFYQAQIANSSTTSFASGLSSGPDHTEESNHVTQVEKIGGRASLSRKVGNILPRRLSRTRSAALLAPAGPTDPGGSGVVIGVSVQEKTIESVDEGDEGHTAGSTAHVESAAGGLRNQKSRMTIAGGETGESKGWIARAKGFTQKFRRKGSRNGNGIFS